MKTLWEVFIITLTANWVSCTIDGLSYMDPLMFKPRPSPWQPDADPCTPLYWYPRNIPEFCYFKTTPKSVPSPPVPKPIPVPLPVPMPLPMPPPPTLIPMPPPPMPMPMPFPPSYMPMPGPFPVMPPLPYGIPMVPSNPMLPVGGIPYPGLPSIQPAFLPPYGPENQAGLVPGLPGIVSPDGGINVLPFSDVYSEILEKHKQKMIRKKIQKLIEKYDYPRIRRFRRRRKSMRRKMDFESPEENK